MNAFWRKEVRQLLPNFSIGLVAAFSVLLLPRKDGGSGAWMVLRFVLPFVFCPAMVVMLALDSFGREVSSGTFAQLLSQPMSRMKCWWTKISLLGGATLLIWFVWVGSFLLVGKVVGSALSHEGWRHLEVTSTLFLWVALSGGLWTVLLFRQVGTAFWFTVLTPLALCVAAVLICGDAPEYQLNVTLSVGLILYGLAGFFLAYWLFIHAQDVQWSGGIIAIPKWRATPQFSNGKGSQRTFRPYSAIFRREFQLHQPQLIIAAGLIALHLFAVAARNIGNGFKGHEVIQAVIHIVWCLWFFMPLLFGCAAVAEERKLGTLEGQLCVPATRRAQLAIKLVVVILLSVVSGALMPPLLESLDGTRFLPNAHDLTNGVIGDIQPVILWYMILLLPTALITGLVSFYFSSLSRNTLQALGPSILGVLIIGFLLGVGAVPAQIIGYPLWWGFIGYVVGIPVVGLVATRLAYWNYRNVRPGWTAWWRNLLAMAAALVFTVVIATALYHRAWEFLLSREPEHGPARLSLSEPIALNNEQGSLSVQLPDGRFWSGNFGYSVSGVGQILISNWRLSELSGGSRFLDGTNWSSVADCIFDTAGIKKDGTLWISRKQLPREFYRLYNRKEKTSSGPPLAPEKYGDDHDWKEVASCGLYALLLKQDGTLWKWATNSFPGQENWPGLSALALERVGSASDWDELRNVSSRKLYARKKDGRVWANLDGVAHTNDIQLTSDVLLRQPFLDGYDWRSVEPEVFTGYLRGSSFSSKALDNGQIGNGFVAGIRDDGTFRLTALIMGRLSPEPVAQDILLDNATNWVALAGSDAGELVALKSDGSLWKCTLPFGTGPKTFTFTRIGANSGWVAISGNNMGLLALAADGNIWSWQSELPWVLPLSQFHVPSLIGVSRWPQFVANIFAEDK